MAGLDMSRVEKHCSDRTEIHTDTPTLLLVSKTGTDTLLPSLTPLTEYGQVADLPWCRVRGHRQAATPPVPRPSVRHPHLESEARAGHGTHHHQTPGEGTGGLRVQAQETAPPTRCQVKAGKGREGGMCE